MTTTALDNFLKTIKTDTASSQSSKLWSDSNSGMDKEQFSKVLENANKSINFAYEKPTYQELTTPQNSINYSNSKNTETTAKEELASSENKPKETPKEKSELTSEQNAALAKEMVNQYEQKPQEEKDSKQEKPNNKQVAEVVNVADSANTKPKVTTPNKNADELQKEIVTSEKKEVKNLLKQDTAEAAKASTPKTKEAETSAQAPKETKTEELKINTSQVQPKTNETEKSDIKTTPKQTELLNNKAKPVTEEAVEEKTTLKDNKIAVQDKDKNKKETSPIEVEVAVDTQLIQKTDTDKIKNAKSLLSEALKDNNGNIEVKNIKAAKTEKPNLGDNKEQNSGNQQNEPKMNLAGLPDTSLNIAKISFEKNVQFNKVLEAQQPKEPAIMNQVMGKMTSELSTGKSEVTIILKPENLGKVDINLTTVKGELTAQITAESKEVLEVLNKNIETLKQNLQDQGVNVGNITVKVQEPQQANNDNTQFNKNPNQQNPDGMNNNSANSNADSNKNNSKLSNSGKNINFNSNTSFEEEGNINQQAESSLDKTRLVDYRV